MSTTFKLCSILLLMAFSQTAIAATYKCEENGQISYSDKPCSGKAVAIDEAAIKSIPGKTSAPSDATRRTKQTLQTLEAARQQREVLREISLLEREVELLQQERDAKLADLKMQGEYPEVDENDDDDELRVRDLQQKLAQEMTAVSASYAEQIQQITDKINVLRGRH
jgi:hypothetical protein